MAAPPEEYDSPPPLAKLIRPGGLWQLYHAGFKLVLIYPDRATPVKWGIKPYQEPWTKQEFQTEIVNRVYNEEFSGIATALGRTHLVNNEGKSLYINAIDVDSLSVYERLETAIEWARGRTYVTRSRRSYGFHIFWMTTGPLPHISKMDMLDQHHLGSFEVKTDKSLGLMTLPPSHHRQHASFQYFAVGLQNHIMTDDKFFTKLVIALQEFIQPEFLYRHDVLQIVGRENIKVEEPKPKPKKRTSGHFKRYGLHDLTDEQVKAYVDTLRPYYFKGDRNNLVFVLAGYLHRRCVKLESALRVIEILAKSTDDRELYSRLKTTKDTFAKPRDKVTGSRASLTKLLNSMNGGEVPQ